MKARSGSWEPLSVATRQALVHSLNSESVARPVRAKKSFNDTNAMCACQLYTGSYVKLRSGSKFLPDIPPGESRVKTTNKARGNRMTGTVNAEREHRVGH